jgi:ABC-2 type transport system permease protein
MVFVWAVLAVIFSGYLIPIERLPWVLRSTAAMFPLRHYMVLVRGVMLKGAGLGILWPEAAALLALSAGITFLTTRIVGRV